MKKKKQKEQNHRLKMIRERKIQYNLRNIYLDDLRVERNNA